MTIAGLNGSDRRQAVQLLVELVPLDELEQLLSGEDLYLAFRSELAPLDDTERKEYLASIIVDVFGSRLLNAASLRRRLSGDQDQMASWRAGTFAAINFVKSAGLPTVFAGTLPPPKSLPSEVIQAEPQLPPLEDYQEETIERAISASGPNKRLLISLPTGAGKTRVACELVTRLHCSDPHPKTTIWIAQSEELCEQAASCIEEVWQARVLDQPLIIHRAWSSHLRKHMKGLYAPGTRDAEHAFVIATPSGADKLLRSTPQGALGDAITQLSALIIDEAHRAATATYTSILRSVSRLHPKLQFVAGLSATPIRETYASNPYLGTENLASLFPILVEPIDSLGLKEPPTQVLQDRQILARPRFEKADLAKPFLKSLVKFTLQKIAKNCNEPAIAYLPSVADAKYFAVRLRNEGANAEFVSGATPTSERLRIIRDIRNGSTQILANCDLLTTGFDAPSVRKIFLARNTRSPVLYKQIVGRGLRGPKFGGSEFCDIYLCNVNLEFDLDPNTAAFARSVWQSKFS